MADGASNEAASPGKIRLLCRYFIHGACSKGSSCNFLHDRSKNVPVDNICRYYQLGQCSYGQRCRYDHVKKGKELSSLSVQKKNDPPANTSPHKYRPQHQGLPPFRNPSDESKPQTQQGLPSLRSAADSNLWSQQGPSLRRPANGSDPPPSRMVTLTKAGLNHSLKCSQEKQEKEVKWAQAKPFVPRQMYHGWAGTGTYAQATAPVPASDFPGLGESSQNGSSDIIASGLDMPGAPAITAETPLCPYYAQTGDCQLEPCPYAHGDICDMCGFPRLHPLDQVQREAHQKECLSEFERDMEESFARQASEDKECGICLERVLDKSGAGARFGILENCNHCFCLECIRQWRSNQETSIETHRACPTCRTHSDFITPSVKWVTTSEEKTKLIQDYKKALAKKPCQYFKQGKGECPFNSSCFYLHAMPDGTIARENVVSRRRARNAEGELGLQGEETSLWDFINARDSGRAGYSEEDFDAIIDVLAAEEVWDTGWATTSSDSDY